MTTPLSSAVSTAPVPRGRAGRRLGRWAGPALVVALVAAAGARFLADPDPASPAAAPVAPTGPMEVVAGLEAAVAARPGDVAAWRQLGQAYLTQAALTGDAGYEQQAAAAFDRGAQLAPTDDGIALGRASLALTQHRFADAAALGRRVLDARPANPEALAVLVDAETELGRYDDAAAHLQVLLDVQPGVAAYSRAAYQRELRGDLDGALTAMVQAEAAAGGDLAGLAGDARPRSALATVIAIQGDVLLAGGRVDEAAERYRRALDLVEDHAAATVGLARAEAGAGRLPMAQRLLEGQLERAPTLGAAIALADVQRRLGVSPGAEELIDTIATIQRAGGANVDLELAVHLADRGTPDVELARRAYRERPSVYGADALGWTLTRAGRAQEALPYVDQALALGGVDPTLHVHAAFALEAVGDRSGGSAALSRAAERPFFARSVQLDAARLAERLGVEVPTAWRAAGVPDGGRR